VGGVREIPLVGAGGEPVDFARMIVSHGVAELPAESAAWPAPAASLIGLRFA